MSRCSRLGLFAALLATLSLSACAPMPSGGSSSLPSLSGLLQGDFSLSPSVNIARNMKGRSIDDAIAALGEPSKQRPVGNTMELEWSDYQAQPYQAWVSDGSSQQVVGMIPGSRGGAATPVFQQTNYGHYENRTSVYECTVLLRMQDSVIVDTSVQGNVCPEFISALRKWAGEKEARNYMD